VISIFSMMYTRIHCEILQRSNDNLTGYSNKCGKFVLFPSIQTLLFLCPFNKNIQTFTKSLW